MRITKILLILIASILSLTSSSFAAPEKDKVIIVLDASGSMWGQIKKEPKISIARNVIKDLVHDWDQNVELGLTVYGHRRKGDCNDIESMVPVSDVTPGEIESKVNKINPVGKTPLSKAVMMAAEELKYTEQKATVILVSDGIETCDFDPCEVANRLEKSGVDFTTHVIGFDITEEDAKKQLTCLAENTGGRFLSASDADSLKSSIDEAVKEVSLSKKNNVELHASYEPNGEALTNVTWSVYKSSDPEGQPVVYGRGPTPKYTLEPGNYLARVKSIGGKASAEKEFEVVADTLNKQEVIIPLEGKVKLVAVNEAGGTPLSEVAWSVETIASDLEKAKLISYGGGTEPEYTLLPGKYLAKVKSQSGKAVAEQEIEVLPGKLNRVEVVMAQEGVVKLIAVNEQGGKPLGDVTWQVNTIPTDLGKSELVSYGKGAQPEYKLLPGKYLATVKSTQGKAETEQEIEVLPGKKTTTEVVMAAEGILSLKAVHTAGGKAIKDVQWQLYTIVPADSMDKPSLVTYGKGSEPEYKLLPGKYTAIVKSNKGVAKVEQEVEVLASKRNQIEVIFPEEGEIQLSAVTEDGKSADRVYWEVFTLIEQDSIEKPERVKVGGGTSPLYRLLPGKYLARATVDREKYEKEIEVVAGKLTKDEIVLSKNG